MDAELREAMRTELAEMVSTIDADADGSVGAHTPVEQIVLRRRMRHAAQALLGILEAHPLTDAGRCSTCRRRDICPTAALLESWAAGWLSTGGLAQQRPGDLRMVSDRRLA